MEYAIAILGCIVMLGLLVFTVMSIIDSILEHRKEMELYERIERELARTEEDEENISFFGQH